MPEIKPDVPDEVSKLLSSSFLIVPVIDVDAE